MTRFEVHEVDPEDVDQASPAIEVAARALAAGLVVVTPTETVYGLAARPDLPEATDRLFAAKRRPRKLSLPVLAPSSEVAFELGEPGDLAIRLAAAFWPGPLTLVLPRTRGSRGWALGQDADRVALRVPDHPLTVALLRRTGPLAATSANVSGRPPLEDPVALVETFGSRVAVYLVLAAGAVRPAGEPSTVVDATGTEPQVVRAGAISRQRLSRPLPGGAPGPDG